MALPITTYTQALSYLTDRLDFEGRPHALPYSPTFYSLDRFARLLDRMGAPHKRIPSIHIAGTKGKGSVAILLESALRAGGFHTGAYTSPHLRDYVERFRLDGHPIAEEEFTRSLAALAPILEADAADAGEQAPYRTVFELLTAMAFAIFAEHGVDLAILETGLGGRLDCTNVVRPEVAVITALGLDHTALLGSSLDRIAWEKGGIIKEGVPVVLAAQTPLAREEGLPVLRRLAEERHAPVIEAETLSEAICLSRGENGQVIELRARYGAQEGPRTGGLPDSIRLRLPLLGDHQVDNLCTAAAVWVVLQRQGWEVTWDAFWAGVEQCRWPGRFEILETRPRVIVDGAHCPLSARALGRTLDALYPGVAFHVIFGAQRDKDHRQILRVLSGKDTLESGAHNRAIRSWAFYPVPGGRGASAEDLAVAALTVGIPQEQITLHSAALEALEAVGRRASSDELVVSFGTLYTIGEVSDRARLLFSAPGASHG